MLESHVLRRLETDLLAIAKPGRYAGNEINIRLKSDTAVTARIGLAFPDLYDVGMSYYGFQILYHILNREPQIAAERIYAPWPDFETVLRRRAIPLYTLETKTPLRELDVLGFHCGYELSFTNLLNMLDLAAIPLLSAQRTEADPVVIAGGSCGYNPEPLAPIIDLFIIGDAEEMIVPLVTRIAALRRQRIPRSDLFRNLAAEFCGVYVPSLYESVVSGDDPMAPPHPIDPGLPFPVRANRIVALKSDDFPTRPLVPLIEITHHRLAAEIMRGCTQGCRFCQAGMIYRPVRERPWGELIHQINHALSVSGYDELSLLSLSSSDYSGLQPLVMALRDRLENGCISLALPSLRVDRFSDELLQVLSQTRKSGLTFAPEAGSERLRRVINKNIARDDLLAVVEQAVRQGWSLVKLYFMLGLPTETDADLEAITQLVGEVLRISGKLKLNLTLSTFIPKPFTPFQWETQQAPDEIQRRLDWLKPSLRALRRVKIMARDPFVSQLEGLLARGDRRMAPTILMAWRLGARFDAWNEHFKPVVWQQAILETLPFADRYRANRATDRPLSWEHIDARISRDFLLTEREKALSARPTSDCRAGCQRCGSCEADLQMVISPEAASDFRVKSAATPRFTSLPPVRYRLWYSKGAALRFTSHLDMIRLFQTILRITGIQVAYSEGFHRHPKIATGLPLPLGYTSEAETIDLTVHGFCAQLIEKINSAAPAGLLIQRSEIITSRHPSLMAATVGVDYQVTFEAELRAEISDSLRMVMSHGQMIIDVPGRPRYDARPLLIELNYEYGRLFISATVQDGRSVRIRDLLTALQLSGFPHTVRRSRIHLKPFNE